MAITFKEVTYTYSPGTPFEFQALKNISTKIEDNSVTAVIGHTGSGKSTFLQHLNALLKPTGGTVMIGNTTITSETSNKNLKPLRKKVGIVFQFPENQLFAETVEKDIAFGPENFGSTAEEASKIAKEMITLVGLPESVLSRSPFELSGGQMRRVAIAGVLAMHPEVLVLDEPTAGLDPGGRREIMQLFGDLQKKQKFTIVLVTHQMEDVANYADHVIVMEHGKIVKEGSPRAVFANVEWLHEKQLDVPASTEFAFEMQKRGFQFTRLPLTESELADDIADFFKKRGQTHE
ncbi:ATPase component of general energizing module of ECF transporter [Pediococcus damnosus]|uniref:Energy-coupling factor transporter ATP-binding protein EcfA2 n=1 Tax=Pediococcus damnosus TaxID=51663 RepID=A0A0R2HE80_9LACO|nr:energy-coupling factor ABC transporter ATP-binding protein [Pediococcus damnosus]AMV61158.1 ATPase component of general energizing module of ECF transporter [Pediococcus damnosus]AMV63716.1 ATPase component of general energizing module of ECF transporter [Pediococcus damnosus]AMV65517.1 ATPase component of general energizing module of ECF transporter [Pediococcus damnosus]AMV66344.1 ATPase component of general energizing module of ECF transporter [Pediococcus damnosus]AMV68643.1 ATPase comp